MRRISVAPKVFFGTSVHKSDVYLSETERTHHGPEFRVPRNDI